MIEMEIRGQAAFQRALQAAIVGIPEHVSREFAGWTQVIFKDLVMNTPQWSGDLAANWNYSVGSPSAAYGEIPRKALAWPPNSAHPPYHRATAPGGSLAAPWAAIGRAEDGQQPSYSQSVYFSNNTPIAERVENDPTWLRPINLVGGKVQMASFTAAKWKNLPFRSR